MTQIKVARLVQKGKPLEVGTAEKPTSLGPNDVLVKVAACGLVPNTPNVINGTYKYPTQKLPAVFGLDVSGTIEAVGAHVMNLKPGDRCYVNPHLSCGTCPMCRRERRDLCVNSCLRGYFAMSEGGATLLEHYPLGGLSEYVVSPDTNIALLPESVNFLTAARLGYIGTSFGALKRGDLGPAKTILINGVTGTLGVSAVAIALGFGATKILGIGRNKERLAQVEGMSPLADRIKTLSSTDDVDPVEWVKSQTGGLGVDLIYDCLGAGGDANSTSALVRGAVRVGGKVLLAAGGADGQISASYLEWMERDTAVLGSFWFTNQQADEMIELIAAGVIDFSFLKHEEFALEDVNEALKVVGDRPGGFQNVVVVLDK
jgi:alcohol dehydrogenase